MKHKVQEYDLRHDNWWSRDRLVAKCSLKSVSPTFYDKRDDFTFH